MYNKPASKAIDKPNMKGLLRPKGDRHLSLKDPIKGANIKPNIGGRLHIIVISCEKNNRN